MEDGVCRQFEVPPLVAVAAPLAVEGGVGEVGWVAGGPWELGEPWEGVAGLGKEEEVAGRVAGLGALSLTDSHSDAPLVLVPSEGVGTVGRVSRLQAGWTRYFRGSGPFCGGREEASDKERGVSRKTHQGPPHPCARPRPNQEQRGGLSLEEERARRGESRTSPTARYRDTEPVKKRKGVRDEAAGVGSEGGL